MAVLSHLGTSFLAGIQHHLPALCAVTAPSVPSYYRLRPESLGAGYTPDVETLDRGASLHLSGEFRRSSATRAAVQLEYRVADATASPYLALALLVQAGLDACAEGARSTCKIRGRAGKASKAAWRSSRSTGRGGMAGERSAHGLPQVQARGDQGPRQSGRK